MQCFRVALAQHAVDLVADLCDARLGMWTGQGIRVTALVFGVKA